MGEIFHTDSNPCPICAENLNGAFTSQDGVRPSPDDYSLCHYCGVVLRFNHDLSLRVATKADIKADNIGPSLLAAARDVRERIDECKKRMSRKKNS